MPHDSRAVMQNAKQQTKRLVKRAISNFNAFLLSYPKNVECVLCGWTGRHFQSDGWHQRINCPICHTGIRHRLPVAAWRHIDDLSLDRLFNDNAILHFAPEPAISKTIQGNARKYVTADFLRTDADLQVNMSDMPQVGSEEFDVVIAFDVLEHVPDFRSALKEVHRVLKPEGYAIFTVPQKDNLVITFEDASIVTEEDRTRHFGQCDHLRIFGDDFPSIIESKGFSVRIVDETSFSAQHRQKYVLIPPMLSTNPLATNHRKAFFCRKTS
jgi:SAM-dependent methyltransferase